MKTHNRGAILALSVISLSLMAAPARAGLVLTATGAAQGLSLSTFISGFPIAYSVGPLGIAFLPGGGILTTDYPGNVRIFSSDIDGQTIANGIVGQTYGSRNAADIAQVGGNIYMTQQGVGNLVQINANGTLNQLIVSGMPSATGMVADPHTGHLFVSAGTGVFEIDPAAKTKTLFAGVVADGLTISADGATIYGEVAGHIIGWDSTTGAKVFDSGGIPGGPDGTAIGAGLFAGELFVNTNGGQLYEINQSTLVQTLLATGGSRGDFVTVDPTNDTLLLTQSDQIVRLTGASFVVTSPEPASLALIGAGLLGLALFRRKK